MSVGRRFWKGLIPLAVVGLAVGSSGGLAAQEERALALLEEAGRKYREVTGFCAGFHQVLEVPLLKEVTESQGTLCQERPNLFAMRFTEPEGDLVVADGSWFWVYYPSSDPRQVLQFEMVSQPGGVDFQREFLESPAEKYTLQYLGEETVAERVTHLIALEPTTSAGFQEARIWLDPTRSLIVRARIVMENGSVRTVTLSDIVLDPPADPARFQFTPPAGAQVIRRD